MIADKSNVSDDEPFDSREVVAGYEAWYRESGRRADYLEKRLLHRMLADFRQSHTAVEIGCGTGHFSRWLATLGLTVTGLDLSAAMLAEAHKFDGAAYLRADALHLPFLDRAFDLAVLITTLEFLTDPLPALSEAVRVARQGLLLGVLNRKSLLAKQYRASGKSLWRSARFFSPFELAGLVRQASGARLQRINWRTTLWPVPLVRDLRLPWGGFIVQTARLSER